MWKLVPETHIGGTKENRFQTDYSSGNKTYNKCTTILKTTGQTKKRMLEMEALKNKGAKTQSGENNEAETGNQWGIDTDWRFTN